MAVVRTHAAQSGRRMDGCGLARWVDVLRRAGALRAPGQKSDMALLGRRRSAIVDVGKVSRYLPDRSR